MTQRNDGGPAFPQGYREAGGDPGMSLRDWFAQSQPSDDLEDLSYRHLSPDARSFLAGEPMPERPCDRPVDLRAERVKYQLDKARWQAKVTAALRYMHADAMLAARSPAQEGAETALAAAARLAEIARIIEYVDNRCLAADGPVTKTRHEMTDDEMRAIYHLAKDGASASPQPDHSELLQQCRDALQAAQRFIGTEYEMIADDGELLAHEARPTYEQVTATLMKLQEALGDG